MSFWISTGKIHSEIKPHSHRKNICARQPELTEDGRPKIQLHQKHHVGQHILTASFSDTAVQIWGRNMLPVTQAAAWERVVIQNISRNMQARPQWLGHHLPCFKSLTEKSTCSRHSWLPTGKMLQYFTSCPRGVAAHYDLCRLTYVSGEKVMKQFAELPQKDLFSWKTYASGCLGISSCS